jgi:hypothetical protein
MKSPSEKGAHMPKKNRLRSRDGAPDFCCFEVVEATNNQPQDLFVVLNGVRVAKRGQPGTPQAKTWVALEPGHQVYDRGRGKLTVEMYGVPAP